jgi:hypothetical protein
MMRRLGVSVLAVVAFATIPSTASASTRCSIGRSASTYTHGGYRVVLDNYRSEEGMACSSVRYVINGWLRRQLARQYGWPRLGRPFYDGWVTWHGYRLDHHRWWFEEHKSGTVFSFRGRVFY